MAVDKLCNNYFSLRPTLLITFFSFITSTLYLLASCLKRQHLLLLYPSAATFSSSSNFLGVRLKVLTGRAEIHVVLSKARFYNRRNHTTFPPPLATHGHGCIQGHRLLAMPSNPTTQAAIISSASIVVVPHLILNFEFCYRPWTHSRLFVSSKF